VEITLDASRTGDTFTGTGRLVVRQAGVVTGCADFDVLGTRTSPPSADCDGGLPRPADLLR
jgi:hypothetical protein